MSIAIARPEHFARVVAFARARGLLPQLTERLWYLHTYRVPRRGEAYPEQAPIVIDWTTFPAEWSGYPAGDTVVTLGYDSAPASLSVDWSAPVGMFGALIYHGTQDGWHAKPGQHTETFAVSLASAADHARNPWDIHT